MLARRKAKLPFYLNALREKEYAERYPGCLLNNFHNLLRFWQRHYLNKDKDSTCLENVRCSHSLSWMTRITLIASRQHAVISLKLLLSLYCISMYCIYENRAGGKLFDIWTGNAKSIFLDGREKKQVVMLQDNLRCQKQLTAIESQLWGKEEREPKSINLS